MDKTSIDDKLFSVKTKSSDKSHLVAELQKCKKCNERCCLHICPANVYSWNEKENTLEIAYENCLECGACRIACPNKALIWNYPESGCGITYKYS